jgi:O-antigen/teichoic acid export membrane protein
MEPLWNIVPMMIAVFSIPVLLKELGKDRFGVLTLAWALIGYASLFDIGLGRALTQVVAKKLGAGEDDKVPGIVWTSLVLMLVLGLIGAGLVAVISPWLVHRLLKIPAVLQRETLDSFLLLAVSIPVVILAAGLRGVLEAHQRFDLVTYLRIPLGIFTFASPLLVLPFSQNLVPVVGILVAGRFLGCLAHYWICLRVAPEIHRGIVWDTAFLGPLLRFGGWMTVTNIISPAMVTMDRFLIGGMLAVGTVTYYVVPFEVISKVLVVPVAFLGVMFPAFSASFGSDRSLAALLYKRSIKYLFLATAPLVVLGILFAKFGLTVWLGPDFAEHSFRIVQVLAVGLLLNSLAQVPYTFVQGIGRPDIAAKLHLVELPIYLAALVWFTKTYGIVGAAIAWTLRMTLDAILLFAITRGFLSRRGRGAEAGTETYSDLGRPVPIASDNVTASD